MIFKSQLWTQNLSMDFYLKKSIVLNKNSPEKKFWLWEIVVCSWEMPEIVLWAPHVFTDGDELGAVSVWLPSVTMWFSSKQKQNLPFLCILPNSAWCLRPTCFYIKRLKIQIQKFRTSELAVWKKIVFNCKCIQNFDVMCIFLDHVPISV